MNRKWFLFTCLIVALTCYWGCSKGITKKETLYFNDFEQDTLAGKDSFANITLLSAYGPLKKTRTEVFNGSMVLGRFNNNAVVLKLDSLPEHGILNISFDLFIHDKWEGDHLLPNTTVPDAWQIQIDGTPILITTFSNGPYKQSYPNWHPSANPNPARGDAADTTLPGACILKGVKNGTSRYSFSQNIAHSAPSFTMDCRDALQPFDSLCLKSWSMDNLRITLIRN